MREREAEAALMSAVKIYAGKRSPRTALTGGQQYAVDVKISGKVRRTKFVREFSGKLDVGANYVTTTSSDPKLDRLVALLLRQGPASLRTWFFTELPRLFEQGALGPPLDDKEVEAVREILERLRSTTTKTNNGRVTLELDK